MRRIACAIAVVSLLFAACAESTSDEEEGATTTKEETDGGAVTGDTTGVTDTEIRIGGIYHQALFGDARAGAQARIERENAAGGIEGRKIVLVDMLDDGSDPNLGTDAARRLVEQERVFAVGPIASPAFAGGDYLAGQGVPFFGWGITPAWCDNEYGFNLVGCVDPSRSTTVRNFARVWAAAADAESLEGLKIAVVADDNDAGRSQLPLVEHVITEDGGEQVYSEANLAPAPAVVGDYTPFATEVVASQPDIVSLLASAGNVIGMAAKLRELGYNGLIFNGILYDPLAVGAARLMTTVLSNAPYEQADEIPAMQRTIEDFDSTNPPTPHSSAALTAYWAMEHFIQILREVGPDLTRERFVEVLNDGFEFDGQGVFPDLTYPDAHTHGIPSCGAAVDSDGTAFQVVVPYSCGDELENPFL